MTGIERLRAFARRMDELSVWPGGAKLLDIAGQIEREHDAEAADSPHDAVTPEDHEAAAWVRHHGGLDHVKSEWRSRVPYDRYERKRQRLLGHIAECETALGRRREIISGLGHRVSDLTRENAELRKRAMPEGYEWPTVDGKPVDFVTGYEPSLGVLEAVSIYSNGACEVMGHDGIIKDVKEIHIATLKVLDADGVEVEVGDDLYSVEGMLKFHVSAIDKKSGRIATEAMFALDKWADPKMYTHRAPVLAADGKPLLKHETVYEIKTGERYFITNVFDGMTEPDFPEHTVECRKYEDVVTHMFRPSQLTHERPDSWEWLEEDANKSPFGYCKDVGHRLDTCENSESYKARDLVRRAKKLAVVGE